MENMKPFSVWDESIHNSPDQVKRIASATKSETSPSCVDREQQTAVFPGSSTTSYTTTLSSCSCMDFSRRHLPCKHIYRLAMELGLIDVPFKVGANKNVTEAQQISLRDAVDEVELLPEKEQITLKDCLYQHLYKKNNNILIDVTECQRLKSCRLINLVAPSVEALLTKKKKSEILSAISQVDPDAKPKGGHQERFNKVVL